MVAAVRKLVQSTSADVAVGDATAFDKVMNETVAADRMVAVLASFFAALSALLVANRSGHRRSGCACLRKAGGGDAL